MKIGFVGLGQMGGGMAANLLRVGHALTVYNRSPEKAKTLVDQGATLAPRPAEAASGDVVISMLADDNAVEQIAFGDDGIIRNLAIGATHISMSTISVALSKKLAAAHQDAGQRYVAAPVFGRPDAAAAAKLSIVAAGAAEAVELCKPLFSTLGQRTFVVGEKPESANLIKLSGNFLIAVLIESLGEAFALVGKAGLNLHDYLDLLTSTLFPAPIYKNYGALIADGKFEPAGFAAPLGQKDIRLTLAAAESLGVPLPLASLLRDRFLTLMAQGGENLDWSAIGQLASKDAGLK